MLGMCLDKRVLGGLAVVGAGMFIFAPHMIVTALPLLLVAICPLFMLVMLFMGKAIMGGKQAEFEQQEGSLGVATSYSCPMHQDIASATPGRCPTWGMALVPVSSPQPIEAPFRTGPALEPAEQVALLHPQLQRLGEQQTAFAQQLSRLSASETRPTLKTSEQERSDHGRPAGDVQATL